MWILIWGAIMNKVYFVSIIGILFISNQIIGMENDLEENRKPRKRGKTNMQRANTTISVGNREKLELVDRTRDRRSKTLPQSTNKMLERMRKLSDFRTQVSRLVKNGSNGGNGSNGRRSNGRKGCDFNIKCSSLPATKVVLDSSSEEMLSSRERPFSGEIHSGESCSSSFEDLEKQIGKVFSCSGKSMINLQKAYCLEMYEIDISSRVIRKNSNLDFAFRRKILKEQIKRKNNNGENDNNSNSNSNSNLNLKSGYKKELLIAYQTLFVEQKRLKMEQKTQQFEKEKFAVEHDLGERELELEERKFEEEQNKNCFNKKNTIVASALTLVAGGAGSFIIWLLSR